MRTYVTVVCRFINRKSVLDASIMGNIECKYNGVVSNFSRFVNSLLKIMTRLILHVHTDRVVTVRKGFVLAIYPDR